MSDPQQPKLRLPFRWVALLTAAFCLLLAYMNATAVTAQVESWGLVAGSGAVVLGLRTGAIYLGLAVLLGLASSAAPSRTRNAISYGSAAITGFLGLAAFYSTLFGEASAAIL